MANAIENERQEIENSLDIAAIADYLDISVNAIASWEKGDNVIYVEVDKMGLAAVPYSVAVPILKSRYYNPADPKIRAEIQDAYNQGLTVVCTCRPIPGDRSWVGEWCGGIHWAAGPLNVFDQSWRRLDAKIIKLITNEEILIKAKNRVINYYPDPVKAQEKIKSLIDRNGIQGFCRAMLPNLPWLKSEE